MVPVLVAVKVNLCLFVLINFYVFKALDIVVKAFVLGLNRNNDHWCCRLKTVQH